MVIKYRGRKKPVKSSEYKRYKEPKQGQDKRGPDFGDVSHDYDENVKLFKFIFERSDDIIFREFEICGKRVYRAFLVYIDGMVDKRIIDQDILYTLQYALAETVGEDNIKGTSLLQIIQKRMLAVGETSSNKKVNDLITSVFAGDTIVIIEGFAEGIVCSTKGWEHRFVGTPVSETTLLGPQEAFNEILRVNTALIRRYVRDFNLRVKTRKIGARSKTDVSVVYIEGIANPDVVNEVEQRMGMIDVDKIIGSLALDVYMVDDPFLFFPLSQETERPDLAAAALYEGRVVIVVDGTPFARIVPTTFAELSHSPDDYYMSWAQATFSRMIRLIGLAITVFAPAFYVALTSHHPEMLPFTLAIAIGAGLEKVPFPGYVEIFLGLILFELLREAGLRLTRALTSTMGVVGGIILGDAAIRAGIVSADVLVTVAIVAISAMVAPVTSASLLARLANIFLAIFAVMWGLYGIFFAVTLLLIQLCSIRSYGVPYMAPIAPMIWNDFKDALLRVPHWLLVRRPETYKPLDDTNQAHLTEVWWRGLVTPKVIANRNNPQELKVKQERGQDDEQS